MKNLLGETTEVILGHGHKLSDVVRVQTKDHAGTWEDFMNLAANVNYDAGFGGEEINTDLKIIGVDWWLERGTYDGSEWWEYKRLPEWLTDAAPLTIASIKEDW